MTTRTRMAAAALGATALAGPLGVIASTYVVRPGDDISDIAVRHGTTVAALAEANHLAGSLEPGQLLRIPDATLGLPSYTADSHDVEEHTVREGEQVFQVARWFGVDATALARLNGIGVNAHLEPGAILAVPGRLARVNALLTQVAGTLDVHAALIRAVAWVESGWQQDVTSPTGAVGLMQIEPYTGEWVSKFLAMRTLDVHVARDNVTAGALLLRHLVAVHEGDTTAALAGYYQGDQSIARNGMYDDTQRYVRVVSQLMGAAQAA